MQEVRQVFNVTAEWILKMTLLRNTGSDFNLILSCTPQSEWFQSLV
jgi:hypothetical protein